MPTSDDALELRLLGPLVIARGGATIALPRSRKVRALLGFLALSPGPVARARLCDLFWDVSNDPRGELRWCLSKIRSVLGKAHRHRLLATAPDRVALDLSGCRVDALEVDKAARCGVAELSQKRLVEVAALFGGDLLAGLHLDGTQELNVWLIAQRHRLRGVHVALLDELTRRSPRGSEETFARLQTWLELAPLDARAHELLLGALLGRGQVRDAERHLNATIRAFEEEGVDWQPLRDRWLAARDAAARSPAGPDTTAPPRIVDSSDGRNIAVAPKNRRASIAVMPFVDDTSDAAEPARVGDGLTEDIITRLAKLRAMFVIARGTVYALRDRNVDPQEAGRILNVDYVLSGRVRSSGRGLSILVELAETRDARIVWTDELHCSRGDAPVALDGVINQIVAEVAEEIETEECNRAVLKPPGSLDAWEAYHRGLWHMYKFNGPDNRHAGDFFRLAIDRDATFARAYAGLSFTHFQNAFLDLTSDREQQVESAYVAAGQSLGADDRDPAAHWAMGRAMWLRGGHDESLAELQRSVDLSPNFALGHYTLGFVESQMGDPRAAIDATDYSRRLSPFDPLSFAMLATRAVAHVRLDQFEEAADWAVKATARPNAHAHILAIAIECLALGDRRDEATKLVARVRERLPAYSVEDFLRAFRFAPDTQTLFRRAARKINFG